MRPLLAASLAFCLGGCSSFLHFTDPGTQAVTCAVTGAVLPLLEDLAITLGIPLQVVESLYGEGCATAAKEGLTQDQAMRFGYEHARAGSYRMAFERKAAP